ncbi:virulence protein SciE type [Pirellula staleyi DSM 6068]|uniref:Virulence protein SciE type n=1 Tax=Pirellula staleyi (strain ATCC 27377 / DSM 6068 / ICPB 4128) TaxID=530564 RepID=D2QZM5_PIRSD|nr:type VI secretion system accessory protein TagJ [Pirellula staleyi]ADB16508.1 virulence protein SciE type [Pirellula staleyi DSM 6068]
MDALSTLRDGNLDTALAELSQKIRSNPGDPKLRVFLFQLLCVQGQWDRALTQLGVSGDMDPIAMPMVQTYREAIRCELLRSDIFTGKRTPLIFGEPEEWIALLMQSLEQTAKGHIAEGETLRQQAFELAPVTSGVIKTANRVPEGESESFTETPFEWLSDADSRLGPIIEAIVNGRYYWIPLHRIRRIDVEKPEDLRDYVWTPVHFQWANGGEVVGLVPTRYPLTFNSTDPLLKLSRKTEWNEIAEGVYHGLGQRMLTTDAGDYALMDVRQIRLDVALDASMKSPEEAVALDVSPELRAGSVDGESTDG